MEIDDYMGAKSIFAGAAAADLDHVEDIEEIDDELNQVDNPTGSKQKLSNQNAALIKDGPLTTGKHNDPMMDDSEEPQPPPYKLSISEYEEMS